MIKDLKMILQNLHSVGIISCSLEPVDGMTLIRGSDKNGEIVVYDTVDTLLADKPMGIHSVGLLLSRINIFDEDKARYEFEEDDECMKAITIKESRRKASYRFILSRRMDLPAIRQDINASDVFTLSADDVKRLDAAMNAMARPGVYKETGYIKLSGETGNQLKIEIYDGSDDTYIDFIEGIDIPGYKGSWDIDPFKLCLNRSAKANDGESPMMINENGVIMINIGLMNVCIAPKVS